MGSNNNDSNDTTDDNTTTATDSQQFVSEGSRPLHRSRTIAMQCMSNGAPLGMPMRHAYCTRSYDEHAVHAMAPVQGNEPGLDGQAVALERLLACAEAFVHRTHISPPPPPLRESSWKCENMPVASTLGQCE